MKNIITRLLTAVVTMLLLIVFPFGVYAANRKPDAPIITVKNSKNTVSVSWQEVENAEFYEIYRKYSGKITKVAETAKTSYSDSDVKNNGAYRYYVKACDGQSKSAYSEGKAIYHMSEPEHGTLKNTKNGISFSWKKVKGADRYYVYRRQAGSSWTLMKRVNAGSSLNFEDITVKNNVSYNYTVRCAKSTSLSSFTKSEAITKVKSPVIESVQSKSEGIYVSWSAVDGADRYAVFRNENGTQWKGIVVTKAGVTNYYDKNVSDGQVYMYTVVAINNNCKSVVSDYAYTMHLKPPAKFTAAHSPNGVRLSWSKVEKADRYVIYRKAQGESSWKRVAVVKNGKRTYSDAEASFGKVNYYRIRSYASGYGYGYLGQSIKIKALDPNKKAIALTYDDGPYTPVTNSILDCLEKYDCRATFFVVGSRVDTYSSCVKRAYNGGNEIANHTYNHTTLTKASVDTINSEINRTNQAIKKYTGENASMVRAPGGSVNEHVLSKVKYPLVNWSVDTQDWKTRNAQSTVTAIKNSVKDGDIILMHDLYDATAKATWEIVPWLKKNGYQMVTVSELMQLKGIDFKAGKLYYSGR